MDIKVKSNIGWLIDKSSYNREEISKIFNKSRNSVSNWCTTKSFPSIPESFYLAQLLEVKVDDLYEVISHKKE
jgi:DNA-binding XRE family transcriptional regulator